MGSRSHVLRWSVSAFMAALIVAGAFSAGADARKSHRPPKSAHKQSEPKATKELLANCDSIIAVSQVSSLTGLDVMLGAGSGGQPAISAQPLEGVCSGSYVVDGTVAGGVNGTVSHLGITIQGQKLTGGPINANAQAAAMYQQDFTVAESQDQACPGSAVYPTAITGVGTKAFTVGQCTATAPEAVTAVDGPVVATMSWQNLAATGGASVSGAEPVINHVLQAVGL
jgi:hypothetical protein